MTFPSPPLPFRLPIKIFILLSQPDQKKIHLPPHIHLHNSLFTHFILPPFLPSPLLFICPSFSITFFPMFTLSSPRSSYHFLTLIENICCTSHPTFMFIVPSLLNCHHLFPCLSHTLLLSLSPHYILSNVPQSIIPFPLSILGPSTSP